jgi:hypothetical protein
MNNWQLIYTKSHQEKVAFDNLTHQKYQYYLPVINTVKILRGKKILSKEPMFSRYLFMRLSHDGHQNWPLILSTMGVLHLGNFKGMKAIFNTYKVVKRRMLLLSFMAKNLTAKFDLRDFKKVA